MEPVEVKYSGGTGEPNDPYQIATADDLMLLGETPDDYDKHFILTADIDLDPNLPGRKVFDKAVIAPDWNTVFTGVFDGNNHTISHLMIEGAGTTGTGLFGRLGSGAMVLNLGLEAVDVNGRARSVGGLVGENSGSITASYSTGTVSGDEGVGGLVGLNWGEITMCNSTVMVTGHQDIGGLVGLIYEDGNITASYSTGTVNGVEQVGGLVGYNYDVDGSITDSYSTGTVVGDWNVGGLVGESGGSITDCYSTGTVSGNEDVGGLVGRNEGNVTSSFWDIETLTQTTSAGGTGLTTAEMQTEVTFLEAGWDFVGETANGPNDIWKIVEGQTYPLLFWQKYGGGTGEPNYPYLIYTAEHLNALGAEPNDYDKHFKLMADIDLSEYVYDRAVIAPDMNEVEDGFQRTSFTGGFDGNDHVIFHLTVEGDSYLGLVGQLDSGAMIFNLYLEAVDVNGNGWHVGGLVGSNDGHIVSCYSAGTVHGDDDVGGLVGNNFGSITTSWSTSSVTGYASSGCLAGWNDGIVSQCYSTGTVNSVYNVGGLVGINHGEIITSCSTSMVSGGEDVGGLVGFAGEDSRIDASHGTGSASGNHNVGGLVGTNRGRITTSYSAGTVTGIEDIGGLVGDDSDPRYASRTTGSTIASFWDMETSGQPTSDGGVGKTTAEMQSTATFLGAGWDFVDETANGTEDIWWILEGDYPRLWWEVMPGN